MLSDNHDRASTALATSVRMANKRLVVRNFFIWQRQGATHVKSPVESDIEAALCIAGSHATTCFLSTQSYSVSRPCSEGHQLLLQPLNQGNLSI